MIEILFSLRMATMVFEKRLPIRRLWSLRPIDARAVFAPTRGNVEAKRTLQLFVYMDVRETSQVSLHCYTNPALKIYHLAVRLENLSDVLFLNYKGEPISERGIRKLVVKYRKNAGITKRASCHTLRPDFSVSWFQRVCMRTCEWHPMKVLCAQ